MKKINQSHKTLTKFIGALLFSGALVSNLASATEISGRFEAFEFPGARMTRVSGISHDGVIVGDYTDSKYHDHGYVRDSHGNFTSFDPVGSTSTNTMAINPAGDVAGSFYDGNNWHGFVRSARGIITTFDFNGALAIYPNTINQKGVIAGYFYDKSGVMRGFIRDAKGKINETVANAIPAAINTEGVVTGTYTTIDSKEVGFVLGDKDDAVTIAFPGDTRTYPSAINSSGAITGWYSDSSVLGEFGSCCGSHGFVRDAKGVLTTFDVSGYEITMPKMINSAGVIVGSYTNINPGDTVKLSHSFVRDAKGVLTTFDPPDGKESHAVDITPTGTIVGYFSNRNTQLGYIFTPFQQ